MNLNIALQIPRGMEWIILIVIVVVLIFGAKKIPELARSIGRAQGEFRKGKHEAELEATRTETPEPTSEEEVRLRLVKAARELGIESEGKDNEQLREEIRKALAK
jgi:sec-independent protein translocase protein TatA